jgi:hypothetical protein
VQNGKILKNIHFGVKNSHFGVKNSIFEPFWGEKEHF